MQEVLAIALQSMQQDMQRLDRISLNVANVTTPGYQREVVGARPLRLSAPSFAQHIQAGAESAVSANNSVAGLNSNLVVQVDSRSGTLKSTGQALDVALAGPGYFQVSTPNGLAYTRQGSFRMDAQGRLVTAHGHPVMGQGGEVFLQNQRPQIDVQGHIYESDPTQGGASSAQRNMPVAKLKVVVPEDVSQLKHLGEGLMGIGSSATAIADGDLRVQQGFLENSNVSSMHEMVHLMQTMRHFESMQKVALSYDEMTGQAIRKLGELS